MPKEYFTVATFRSRSNGSVWHRVSKDETGALSCTCPGWCRRVAKDGSRTCRHIRKVRANEAADRPDDRVRNTPTRPPPKSEKLGVRRFRLG